MKHQTHRPQKQKTYQQRKHFDQKDTVPKPLSFEQLFRKFKKKIERSGILQEVSERQHFEKPSQKKQRKKKEAIRKERSRQAAEHLGPRNRKY